MTQGCERRAQDALGSIPQSGRMPAKQLEGDDHDGTEVGEGAEDPHDGCAENLILKHGDTEGIRVVDVVAVDGAIAECEERGEHGVHQVRADQVDKDSPVALLGACGPWPEDAVPEEHRCAEEAEVLDDVPVLVFEGEIVGLCLAKTPSDREIASLNG